MPGQERQYTDPDGISYLDMSDAVLRHNWHLLINPHWSPFLSILDRSINLVLSSVGLLGTPSRTSC